MSVSEMSSGEKGKIRIKALILPSRSTFSRLLGAHKTVNIFDFTSSNQSESDPLETCMALQLFLSLLLLGAGTVAADTQLNMAPLSKQLSEFENALHLALSRQRAHEETEDNQRSENKNQGLINTIVNHNNKLKTFENKFYLVVNNFANSSPHVKEVHERTTELEKQVFGAPQPHKSWRELLLLAITVVALWFCLLKFARKYVAPRWIKWLHERIVNPPRRLETISEHVAERTEEGKIRDLKLRLQNHMAEQKEQLKIIVQRINGGSAHNRLPAKDWWNSSDPNRSE